jgi:hypothetical protein
MVRGILLNLFMVAILGIMVGTIILGIVSTIMLMCQLLAGGFGV